MCLLIGNLEGSSLLFGTKPSTVLEEINVMAIETEKLLAKNLAAKLAERAGTAQTGILSRMFGSSNKVLPNPQVDLDELAGLYQSMNYADITAIDFIRANCNESGGLFVPSMDPGLCSTYLPILFKVIEGRIGTITSQYMFSDGILKAPPDWPEHANEMLKLLEEYKGVTGVFGVERSLVRKLKDQAEGRPEDPMGPPGSSPIVAMKAPPITQQGGYSNAPSAPSYQQAGGYNPVSTSPPPPPPPQQPPQPPRPSYPNNSSANYYQTPPPPTYPPAYNNNPGYPPTPYDYNQQSRTSGYPPQSYDQRYSAPPPPQTYPPPSPPHYPSNPQLSAYPSPPNPLESLNSKQQRMVPMILIPSSMVPCNDKEKESTPGTLTAKSVVEKQEKEREKEKEIAAAIQSQSSVAQTPSVLNAEIKKTVTAETTSPVTTSTSINTSATSPVSTSTSPSINTTQPKNPESEDLRWLIDNLPMN